MKQLASPSSSRNRNTTTDTSVLGSTSRKFLTTARTRREHLESQQDKNAAKREKKIEKTLTLKIIAKAEEKKIPLSHALDLTVRQFKDEYLEDEFEEGKYDARLVWGGKELKNTHYMKDFDLGDNPTIHVFLFKVVEHEADISKLTTVKTDHSKGVDFDYFVEKNAVSEEELSWKRFNFHSPYIMRSQIEHVSDYHLFMREIDFMTKHKELRTTKKDFKNYNFGDFDENETLEEESQSFLKDKRKVLAIVFILVLTVVLGPLTMGVIKMNVSKFSRRVIVGVNVLLIILMVGLNVVGDLKGFSLLHIILSSFFAI